jgi:hypothetical protein
MHLCILSEQVLIVGGELGHVPDEFLEMLLMCVPCISTYV